MKLFTVGDNQFFVTFYYDIVDSNSSEAVITLTEATENDTDLLKYKVNDVWEYYKLTATGVKKADSDNDPNFNLIRVGSSESALENEDVFDDCAYATGLSVEIDGTTYSGAGQLAIYRQK